MKTHRLEGTYVTIAEYAKANNISKRGASFRVRAKSFPYELVDLGGQLLIKIS